MGTWTPLGLMCPGLWGSMRFHVTWGRSCGRFCKSGGAVLVSFFMRDPVISAPYSVPLNL